MRAEDEDGSLGSTVLMRLNRFRAVAVVQWNIYHNNIRPRFSDEDAGTRGGGKARHCISMVAAIPEVQ